METLLVVVVLLLLLLLFHFSAEKTSKSTYTIYTVVICCLFSLYSLIYSFAGHINPPPPPPFTICMASPLEAKTMLSNDYRKFNMQYNWWNRFRWEFELPPKILFKIFPSWSVDQLLLNRYFPEETIDSNSARFNLYNWSKFHQDPRAGPGMSRWEVSRFRGCGIVLLIATHSSVFFRVYIHKYI